MVRSQRTWRDPTQTQEEHINSSPKGSQGSNIWPQHLNYWGTIVLSVLRLTAEILTWDMVGEYVEDRSWVQRIVPLKAERFPSSWHPLTIGILFRQSGTNQSPSLIRYLIYLVHPSGLSIWSTSCCAWLFSQLTLKQMTLLSARETKQTRIGRWSYTRERTCIQPARL